MSFRVQIELVCDGCGKGYGTSEYRKSGVVGAMGELEVKAKLYDGWLLTERGRGHTPTHHCPVCADRVGAKKVKKPKERTWIVPPLATIA